MSAAPRFPVEPMADGRFTIVVEVPRGLEIPGDGRQYGLDIAMSRDEALDLRDRLIELLDRASPPADSPFPCTDKIAPVEDLAATVSALYRPGGTAFAEDLNRRLKDLEAAHAKLEAYAGPSGSRASTMAFLKWIANPTPAWPQAMRTDAASRAKPALKAAADLKAAQAAVAHAQACEQTGWMGA